MRRQRWVQRPALSSIIRTVVRVRDRDFVMVMAWQLYDYCNRVLTMSLSRLEKALDACLPTTPTSY
jgi:hypothetical protein